MEHIVMEYISPSSDLTELETYGKQVYSENSFFRDIATFMENPENQQFYKKYMQTKSDMDQVVIFLHLYNIITECMSQHDLDGLEKLAIMDKFLKNSDLRYQLCQCMNQWIKSNDIKFIE